MIELAELRSAVVHHRALSESTSRWSVGMHIHHCCLAARAICAALEQSNDPPPRSVRTLLAIFVLWRGRLPKGRARAPEFTLPRSLTEDELRALIAATESDLVRAAKRPKNSWFAHPVLGPLTRDRALRFVQIHNQHHGRIVRAILAESTPDRTRASTLSK